MEQPPYIFRKEMAEILGCHRTHIGAMIKDGRINLPAIYIKNSTGKLIPAYSRMMFMELVKYGIEVKRKTNHIIFKIKPKTIGFNEAYRMFR